MWNLDKRQSYVVKSKTKIIKMTHQNIGELRLKPTVQQRRNMSDQLCSHFGLKLRIERD